MKLCIDCKHILFIETVEYSRCKRTKTETINPVNGEIIVRMKYCDNLREGNIAGYCGVHAHFWEAKK